MGTLFAEGIGTIGAPVIGDSSLTSDGWHWNPQDSGRSLTVNSAECQRCQGFTEESMALSPGIRGFLAPGNREFRRISGGFRNPQIPGAEFRDFRGARGCARRN